MVRWNQKGGIRINTYTMDSTLEIAKVASIKVEDFLRKIPETIDVINVEDDKYFQKKDIDLLWIYKGKNSAQMLKIEIKGDRYSHTGNYFIETISNQGKNTPGCFLYTEADYIFYYFVDSRELNLLPMPYTREWFLSNKDRFVEKKLTTSIGNNVAYSSTGLLVPKQILNKEVDGVKVKILD